MTDIASKKLIVFKGLLFGLCLILSAGLIVLENPSLRTGFLLLVLIWASARSYYFLFYVLHTYVDPKLKFSGLGNLVMTLLRNATHPTISIPSCRATEHGNFQ
jgi:hypothetical protein